VVGASSLYRKMRRVVGLERPAVGGSRLASPFTWCAVVSHVLWDSGVTWVGGVWWLRMVVAGGGRLTRCRVCR
jgi:hypothetical protein